MYWQKHFWRIDASSCCLRLWRSTSMLRGGNCVLVEGRSRILLAPQRQKEDYCEPGYSTDADPDFINET